MSDVRREASAPGSAQAPQRGRETGSTPTVWAGWVLFGAMMMVMLGSFQALAGLIALFDDGYYAVASKGLLVHVDYTWWGWVHLLIGVAAFVAGFGLMRGLMWARVTGVVVAMISAIVNLGFLAAFPLWALTMIVLDVVIIYAITTHGGELKSDL